MVRLFTVLLLFLLLIHTTASAQPSLSPTHPKYRTAKKVFDELIRAIGDGRTQPKLRLLPSNALSDMRVVWYASRQNAVVLEERAYDLCTTLQADSLAALAFLLGHELAHYYNNHKWTGDFSRGFADLEVGRTLKSLQGNRKKLIEIETEADYFGSLYSYIAGYGVADVVGPILGKIHADYGLDENLEGYPSLDERQIIAQRSQENLRRTIPIFEAGNHLLLIRRYEEAAHCFDFIARTFPSREILNNAGVAHALEAVSLFAPGQLPFAYPFELDAQTRLRHASKAQQYQYTEPREERRERFLLEAVEIFATAQRKDPAYAAAVVNLACVFDLLGRSQEAVQLATKALAIAHKNGDSVSTAHALIARGIALARTVPPQLKQARQDLTAAQHASQALAQFNLNALSLEKTVVANQATSTVSHTSPESIAGLQARDYDQTLNFPDTIARIPATDEDRPDFAIYNKRTQTWDSLVIDTGYSTISFLSTTPNHTEFSARGLRIGHPLPQLNAAYGPPDYLIVSRRGTFHVYTESRIIFHTDAHDTLRSWLIYCIE